MHRAVIADDGSSGQGMNRKSTLRDQPDSFGWISIGLHWSSAVAITALWVLGQSIQFLPADAADQRRDQHVLLGLTVWLLLALRIGWRLKIAHPRATGQTALTHRIARATHYLILLMLGVMLVTGPVLAFFSGGSPTLTRIALTLHSVSASVLALLVFIHVAGALKHLMFSDDETLARIFVPRKATVKSDCSQGDG